MALIQCKECGKDVSSDAHLCAHCGIVISKPKRSFFGKIIKFLFIAFNILMLIWCVSYFVSVGDLFSSATSSAEQAGTAVGTAIGVSILAGVWVAGDIILGIFVLFTRPKK